MIDNHSEYLAKLRMEDDKGYLEFIINQQKKKKKKKELRRLNTEIFKYKITIDSLETQVENWKIALVKAKKYAKKLRQLLK